MAKNNISSFAPINDKIGSAKIYTKKVIMIDNSETPIRTLPKIFSIVMLSFSPIALDKSDVAPIANNMATAVFRRTTL